MRGMKSHFEMDAAVCLEPEEGDVVIHRKKIRNVLLLVVLGLAGIGVLALAPSIFRDIQRDETTLWGAMDQILTAEQQDGEEIELGTVSGSKMKQRAEGIAHLIERVTGAIAQFTYLEADDGDFIVSPEEDE